MSQRSSRRGVAAVTPWSRQQRRSRPKLPGGCRAAWWQSASGAPARTRWSRLPVIARHGHVSLFEDLGLDRLLAGCSDGELTAFRDATLGTLLAYDAAHQSELVRTLETFLACGGNAARAAQALFIHYNTLRHRLATIEQVLALDLDDADARLSLGLGLRVLRMLPR